MSNFLSRALQAFAPATLAAAVALSVASPAQAATPKISGYTVSGGFTIWVEPATAPGEPRQACIVGEPTIAMSASGFSAVPNGGKLYFQGLWQTKYGFGVPFPGGLLQRGTDSVSYLSEGPVQIYPVSALQLIGDKGSVLVVDRSGLAKRGRITVVGWYAYRQKILGLTMEVPKFLPLKSASFEFVDKPAGACFQNGTELLLKS